MQTQTKTNMIEWIQMNLASDTLNLSLIVIDHVTNKYVYM